VSVQVRLSNTQYEALTQLAKKFDMKRTDLLNNAIIMLRFLSENSAASIKSVDGVGEEKEFIIPMLIGK